MSDLRETYAKPEIHQAWESVYRSNPRQDRLNDLLLERVLRLVAPPPAARFLDAGCGVGDHTIRIAQRGFRCVGVDISQTVLQHAQRNAQAAGVAPLVRFSQQALEELSFADGSFEVVHCRGVLTHVPHWERALSHLCRVLKPGGSIVIFELNRRSLEANIVMLARRLMKRSSTLVVTPGGWEFWSEENGSPFVMRIFNLQHVLEQLEQNRIVLTHRFASEFWDINRLPSGFMRNLGILFNRVWFSSRLPAAWSSGNALIGSKAG